MTVKTLKGKYKSLPVQVRASFWFLICSFLQKGIGMLTTPIFTRLMTTAEYGQFNVFSSWHAIAGIIVGLSLTAGVHQQGLVKFNDERAIFSSSLQGLSTTLVALWLMVFLLFQVFWERTLELTTVQILSMLILIWTSSVFGFWANEQRMLYRYGMLVIITLVVSVATPALGIVFMFYAEDKVTARIIGMVIASIIGYTWMFIAQIRKGRVFFSKHFWKYALLFNLPLLPHYLSIIILASSDRIMIERMIGADEAGIYSLAYSVSLIMTLFNSALMQTLNPWMYQKIRDKKEKELAPVAYSTLVCIAVVNLILILLAPEVVAVFAPKAYHEAIWVIPPVAMSVFFMYCYDLFAKFAFYYEKTKFIMTASVLGAVSNIVLNYVFINRYGYIAAGYTTLICYIIYAIGHYYFMRKICKEFCDGRYPYDTKTIMEITLPFLLVGFVFLFTYRYTVIRYLLLVCALISLSINHDSIFSYIKGIIGLKKSTE